MGSKTYKITFSIPEKKMQQAMDMLHDYYSLKVTKTYLHRLLKNNLCLVEDTAKGYVFDTSVRESFASAISQDLGVGRWPRYKDGQEYSNKFWKRLEKACKETKGIALVEEDNGN